MKKIKLDFGSFVLEAELNETGTADEIYRSLPIESKVNLWGEEIYFKIPVIRDNELPTMRISVGDLGYWPEDSCLCVFFGKTPVSKDNTPLPYSEVTVVGRFSTTRKDIENLKGVKQLQKIKILKG